MSTGAKTTGSIAWRTIGFIVLVSLAVSFVVPFAWQTILSLSSNADTELVSKTGLPPAVHPENYSLMLRMIPFGKYFFNSLFVAGWITIIQVISSAMAAYAFSRMEWPGRDKVFLLYLATMMIPDVVLMVPRFAVVLGLDMYNNYAGLILPVAFSAFGTFLLRQFMLTIPKSLDEAAAIDGASHWQVFSRVILPLARPGIIVLAIFTFLFQYNSFFWPLILIKDTNLRTLPIGLLEFDTSYGQDTPKIMAASLLAMIPAALLFLALQKYLVKGIQLGAVKG
ncbi:MAG: carbohydrate ABC transporter permease [Phycisphaerales bacterium]|nr:carbohydrate ABC transporter permease [Phycisphaerales bacterium]